MSTLSIKVTGYGPSMLGHIGSVVDVIAARIPDSLANKRFNAEDYAYGFELGTPKNIQSLGESILVNGRCYTTSTDNTADDYKQTISGKEFTTSGIFLIPHNAKPSHSVVATDLDFQDFLTEVYQYIQQPLAFVALAELNNFHSIAISKAPIDGKNIFEHKDEYYPIAEIREKNVWAFLIGALTDFNDPQHETINQQLKVVLYRNPFDQQFTLTQHVHALTLNKYITQLDDISEINADRVVHLLADGTDIQNIKAKIYTIDELIDFEY